MYYPEELVEEVRQKNDIVDVISGYVRIKKKGSNYVGLCPFHNEKTGSFMVSRNKQIYKCFGCGAGGNVFTFVMEYENYTFVEAMKQLAERAGVKLPEAEYDENAKKQMSRRAKMLELNKDAANYFYYQLRAPQGETGMRYFKGRELSEETMKKFGLGFANVKSNDLTLYLKSKGYTDAQIRDAGLATYHEKYGMSDKFWNRVMFPIQDINHRVIGFGGRVIGEGEPKYLNSPETEVFDKSRNLYGLNFARTSRKNHMIICEGYMDVIAMHQAGFTEAVASLGTAFTSGQASLLRRYTENVILAYDSDGAGTKAALRAIGILRDAGLTGKILHLEPYKDPDEFMKHMGKEAFEERLANAEDSFSFELRMLERDYDMKVPESKMKFRKAVVEKLYQVADQFEDAKPFIEMACEKYHFGYDEMCKSVAAFANKQEMNAGLIKKREPEIAIKQEKKDEPLLKNQKILLTWLVDEPLLYGKIKKYISPEDFAEGIHRKAAVKLFEALEAGQAPSPSAIMTTLQADEEAAEDDQKEIAALFCTKISDHLRKVQGIGEVDIEDAATEFDTKAEKEKALHDIIMSIKRASLQAYMEKSGGDKDAFAHILEAKKALQELQKTHISLD
ncbi:MAG: DNA primase [Lachnospiraceae bacterium]|nr:DNA primase [Lachnospiraceae bacterium]